MTDPQNLFVPRSLLKTLMQAGLMNSLPVAAIFQRCGVDIMAPDAWQGMVPLSLAKSLLEAMIAASPNRDFALSLGQLFAFEHIDGIGPFLLSGDNAQAILDDVSRFKALLLPVIDLVTVSEPSCDRVIYRSRDRVPIGDEPYFAELLFSALVKIARGLLADEQVILKACFRHGQPACLDRYREIFNCPLEFHSQEDELWLKPGVLQRPLATACPEFHQQAEPQLLKTLAQLQRSLGLRGEIRQLLLQRLGQASCDLDSIAEALGASPRTLQRRLKAEGLGFAELREQVQQELACDWLRNTTCSIDRIADDLEFSDRAAFSRAFKRWTGQTPAEFRQQ